MASDRRFLSNCTMHHALVIPELVLRVFSYLRQQHSVMGYVHKGVPGHLLVNRRWKVTCAPVAARCSTTDVHSRSSESEIFTGQLPSHATAVSQSCLPF
jgi:hypothetical protein